MYLVIYLALLYNSVKQLCAYEGYGYRIPTYFEKKKALNIVLSAS